MITNKRNAAFLIIYCNSFGDSKSERFLVATRWSGTYGFIGGEIKSDETIIDGLIRECIEEIGINLTENKNNFCKLNSYYNKNKNMEFHTYTLKLDEAEIKKIWSEWRLNGQHAEYEISGLSLMRTDDTIIDNFMKNNFAGNSKKDLIDFIDFLKIKD